MPSNSTQSDESLRDRATAQRNVAIYVAILVAVPVGYGFHTLFDGAGGDFLLVMTLAVGVPTAYNDTWPADDRPWKAISWILLACVLATAAFTGLFLAGRELLRPLLASVGAFLVTSAGVHLIPYWWRTHAGTSE